MNRFLTPESRAISDSIVQLATEQRWPELLSSFANGVPPLPTVVPGLRLQRQWVISDGDLNHWSLLHHAVDAGDATVCAALMALAPALRFAVDASGRSPYDLAVHLWPKNGNLHSIVALSAGLPAEDEGREKRAAVLRCALASLTPIAEVSPHDTMLIGLVADRLHYWSEGRVEAMMAASESPKAMDAQWRQWERSLRVQMWKLLLSATMPVPRSRRWGDSATGVYTEWASLSGPDSERGVVNMNRWGAACFAAMTLLRDGSFSGVDVVQSERGHAAPIVTRALTLPKSMAAGASSRTARFFVFGDWGEMRGLKELAKAMKLHADECPPDMVLVLGDNFYPAGIGSVRDKRMLSQWRDMFTRRRGNFGDGLAGVPWKLVVGNHDFKGNMAAQYEYSEFAGNHDGVWQMRGDDPLGEPSADYNFSVLRDGFRVDIVGVNTCAAQYSCQRVDSEVVEKFKANGIPQLETALKASVAREADGAADGLGPSWRIVMGHHPFYTNGRGHSEEGKCLRDASYTTHHGSTYPGFALESRVFDAFGVDMYLAGHEHVLQHAIRGEARTQHAVCGASLEQHWYKGSLPVEERQVDKIMNGAGFAVVTATATTLTLEFISVADRKLMYSVSSSKGPTGAAAQ